MSLYVFSMLAGIVLLVWGADKIVLGAAVMAKNLGVSTMLIGLTVVGFATSAPEIVVSATAAIRDATHLAIGNAIGSNIADIGLVVGLTAIVHPLVVQSQTLRRELPVMVAVSVIPVIVLMDFELTRADGGLLLAAFVVFIYWIIRLGRRTSGHDSLEAEYAAEIPGDVKQGMAGVRIVVGLIILVIGSNLLVWGSHNLALSLGISDLVIGVTIVAVGTSLPELAVSIVAVRKGLHGLALGNIIGSNAFNMLAVIGVAAVLRPTTLESADISLHLKVMLAFTVAFFFMAYNYTGIMRVNRAGGALLLAGFVAYHSYLAQQNF
jgi:cation:H+ antiporter